MRKLKFTLSRIALTRIYVSYVLPIIEYSSVVWDNCSDQDAYALEKLQNEAAGIITGFNRSVSLDKLYRECGWVALSERRKNQKLYFMYKALNGQVPSYISDIIPPHIRETTNYSLRNRDNITVPFCRTELLRNSCMPSSVPLWNKLDENIRNSSSFSSFKYEIKRHNLTIHGVPQHYLYGDRYLSGMHARIRNECNTLNSDLHQIFLLINPFCNCNLEIENAEHYFFRCPKYLNERTRLFNETRTFHPLNLDILLYGVVVMSLDDNMSLFKSVQTYIKDTGRFSGN